MIVSRQNIVRRVGRGIVLFLTGAFLLLTFAQAANITITGSWSLTIGAGNLQGGAGSDLTSTYTTASGAISMAVSAASAIHSGWSVSVLRIDTNWNANFVLSIMRTGNGSGTGTVSGGTSYLQITTTSNTFVTGSGSLTGITLQEQLGGVSVSIPAATYTTTIQFTATDS
jgi:hypothetical protein